jgi:hypothetical protein
MIAPPEARSEQCYVRRRVFSPSGRTRGAYQADLISSPKRPGDGEGDKMNTWVSLRRASAAAVLICFATAQPVQSQSFPDRERTRSEFERIELNYRTICTVRFFTFRAQIACMKDTFKSWGVPQSSEELEARAERDPQTRLYAYSELIARDEFLEGAKQLQAMVDAGTLSDTAAMYSMQERLVDVLDPECTYSIVVNGNQLKPPPACR